MSKGSKKIPTLAEFLEASKLANVSAEGLLSCEPNEIEILAKVLGLKPGHRARFLRSYLFHRESIVEEEERKAKESEKNELVLIDSILPFASFLTSLDSKDRPAFITFMEDAGDAAIKLRLVFHKCDKNGDMVLDQKEFISGISDILLSSKEWLIPYVEYMYKNAPYFITPEERGWLKQVLEYLKKHFVKSLYPAVQLAAKETKEFKDWFDMVDTNNDGHIDAREFSRGTVLLLFKSMDKIVLKAAKSAMQEAKKDQPEGKLKYVEFSPKKGRKGKGKGWSKGKGKGKLDRFSLRYKNSDEGLPVLGRPPSIERYLVSKPELITDSPIEPIKPPRGKKPYKQPVITPSMKNRLDMDVPIRCINRPFIKPRRIYGREFGKKVDGNLLHLLSDAKAIKKGLPNEDWSVKTIVSAYSSKPEVEEITKAVLETGLLVNSVVLHMSRQAHIRLRDAWLIQARGEHASVASFANHALELMKFGAPAALIEGALIAGQDEIRHAQACFAFASRFDPEGKTYAPTDFPIGSSADIAETMEGMAGRLSGEGCYGETIGTVLAARQYFTAKDPQVKEELRIIIKEETNHAKLAWDTARWAIQKGGRKVFNTIRGRLENLFARGKLIAKEVNEEDNMSEEDAKYLEHFGIVSHKDFRATETKIGGQMVRKLLVNLEAVGGAECVETKGKIAKGQEWNPVATIAEFVNQVAHERIL